MMKLTKCTCSLPSCQQYALHPALAHGILPTVELDPEAVEPVLRAVNSHDDLVAALIFIRGLRRQPFQDAQALVEEMREIAGRALEKVQS